MYLAAISTCVTKAPERARWACEHLVIGAIPITRIARTSLYTVTDDVWGWCEYVSKDYTWPPCHLPRSIATMIGGN